MCFGNRKCQNDPEYPSPNNYCGGFALSAILVELRIPGTDDPLVVYGKIQEYQNVNVRKGVCRDFLHDPTRIASGTYMSLPSGICAAFNSYNPGKSINVYCTSTFASKAPFSDLLREEVGRIGEDKVHTITETSEISDCRYTLVLVNDCHWVAVKKEDGGVFVCYDPAEGTAIVGDTMEKSLENSKYKIENVSGLFICIS